MSASSQPSSPWTHKNGLPQTPEEWRLGPLPPSISLFAMAGALGLLTGVTAFVLKQAIKWLSLALTSHFHPDGANWVLLFIPLIGILFAVAIQKYVARRRLQHGVDQMEGFMRRTDDKLPTQFIWGPLLASTFTLGFGGSAGAEGPIATSGASLGSYLGRKFNLPPRLVMILIACGAGAGIAGIFKAPIGGVMFTVEVLAFNLATVPLIALIIACLISGMTALALSGFTLDVPLQHVQHFDPSMCGWLIVLGVFCGLYSLYYNRVGKTVKTLFMKAGGAWPVAIASGLILSGLVFVFPALYGEGYSTMARIIDGDLDAMVRYSVFNLNGVTPGLTVMVLICGGIALAKPAATIATNSGGGVAGDFAPTLFAGCMTGIFFASVLNDIFGLGIPVNNFALSAMAAVMAGVIEAPLMAIFIVIEMTGYVDMTFPVMLTAGVSYGTVLLTRKISRRS